MLRKLFVWIQMWKKRRLLCSKGGPSPHLLMSPLGAPPSLPLWGDVFYGWSLMWNWLNLCFSYFFLKSWHFDVTAQLCKIALMLNLSSHTTSVKKPWFDLKMKGLNCLTNSSFNRNHSVPLVYETGCFKWFFCFVKVLPHSCISNAGWTVKFCAAK